VLPLDGAPLTELAAHFAVTGLTLTAFRNYERMRLDLDGRPVVLTGSNGAGKTNILEAISFLGAGRGLRSARLIEVDRQVSGASIAPWAVAAVLENPMGRFEVGTGRDGQSLASRRIVRIDGKPQSGPAALAERVPVLWLTPAQDRLFHDQPGSRRRFLDKLVAVLDPAHATRISEYEKSMRERARLLRDGRLNGGADASWLTALEHTMATSGIAIAAARQLAAADLTQAADSGIGPFPAALIAVVGETETWLDEGPALAAEERLAKALADCRQRDGEHGGAGVGPHRSDMVVEHRDRALGAAQLSTGEQKTLLISIILGAARLQATLRGFAPIILLDEVAAHLDDTYRQALYQEIAALGAQAWMTGVDADLFSGLGDAAQFFKVDDGALKAP
jgi:DNA replication and repair protein RecF